tara:strand:- start:7522 stop:8064 length:543 start_codon:yes stop_codon:yes gene_type:complete
MDKALDNRTPSLIVGTTMLTDIGMTPHPPYYADLPLNQQQTIIDAIAILEARLQNGDSLTSAIAVKQFCQLHVSAEKDEFFCALFLDNQHRLIAFERLFRGTIDGASVHPRVVVRRALELNAAAIIFAHNHPSGITTPSQQDISITKRLKESLALIDVRVLDHIVVAGCVSTSIAEAGLM